MSNVVDINKVKLDNILKKIKRQEDLIEEAKRSPLVSLAELAIQLAELRIEAHKQKIQEIHEAAFGKEFMKSKNKGRIEEYYE